MDGSLDTMELPYFLCRQKKGDAFGGWAETYSYCDLATGRFSFRNNLKDSTCSVGYPILTTMGTRQVMTILGNSGSISVNTYGGSTNTDIILNATIKYDTSDIRLKENIKDTEVTDALDIINRIKIHQFDWKIYDNENEKHQKIGFVADELEELDKKLTYGGGYLDEEENHMCVKGVDNFYLMGYVVKALQELSTKIDKLTK